jgi:hypothetical protein
VFEHDEWLPPTNFLGSPEWWAVAKNSRRLRATKDATAALRAIRALGLAVVPRAVTPAMERAGAAHLTQGNAPARDDPGQAAREVWTAMLEAAESDPA